MVRLATLNLYMASQYKTDLSYEEVHERYSYDPETGDLTSRRTGRAARARSGWGYITVIINRKTYMAHRIAWLLHYGQWPTNTLDHINGIQDDNRICNLREATLKENLRNRGRFRNNKLGVKGVCQDTRSKKFRAQLWRDGRFVLNKSFNTVEEAAAAYRAACLEQFGMFARPE